MKMPRYLCFGVFLIALVFYFPLHSVLWGEAIDTHAMEKISIDAVNKEYSWAKKDNLVSRIITKTYFKNTLLYNVHINNMTHSPIFIVAVDERKKTTDVFLPYRDAKQFLKMYENKNLELSSKDFLEKDIEKYSNIISKESLIIKETNIKYYIESFLYLVNLGFHLIDSVDDIKYLPDELKSKLKKDVPNVSPLKYDFKGDNINIEFYTYSYRGYLMKWNLSVSQNGEVISFKTEEFLTINMLQ